MSSILTNTSSMVALQTLKGINNAMNKTQQEISTGKSIASAKDNSAIWAISKVMESDVSGFKAISDSLSLGQSSVAVARNASESITDLLTKIKSKVVAAQEENVDRSKIQTDIGQLRDQVSSIVDAAQFNGLNLLKGTDGVDILSSLDRASDGTVSARQISIARGNLEQNAAVLGTGTDLTTGALSATTAAGKSSLELTVGTVDTSAATYKVTLGGTDYSFAFTPDPGPNTTADTDTVGAGLVAAIGTSVAGLTASYDSATDKITLDYTGGDDLSLALTGAGVTAAGSATKLDGIAEAVTFDKTGTLAENDSFGVTVGSSNYNVVASGTDTFQSIATSLANLISADSATNGVAATAVQDSGGNWTVKMVNTSGSDITVALAQKADGTQGGGLEDLAAIDVSTAAGAKTALAAVEGLIQTSINAAASFGSAQSRIETQSSFISKLTDSLKAGIGTMVDADMEETSARLQALQVQQQLGIQSLSIANQSPQSILSLFR